MSTRPCKIILLELKKLTENTEAEIAFLGDTTCFIVDSTGKTYDYQKYKNEIHGIIDMLVANGYAVYTKNKYFFCLTQKTVRHKSFRRRLVANFMLTNILVPALVSLVTTLLTLLITWLLTL